MKFKLILALFLTIVFGGVQLAEAQTGRQVKLRVNQQKTVFGGLNVRFVSVIEDSRCPADANCVWAGNAKVRIQVKKSRGGWKTLELNSNLNPKTVTFEGYEIKLTALTPYPRSNIRINRNGYTATLVVTR